MGRKGIFGVKVRHRGVGRRKPRRPNRCQWDAIGIGIGTRTRVDGRSQRKVLKGG